MKPSRISLTDAFFIVLFFILLLVAYLSYKKMDGLNTSTELINHTNMVKLELEQTLSYLKDAEAGQYGYLLTKDTSYLRPFYGAIRKAAQTAAEVDSLTRDDAEQQYNVKTLHILLNDKSSLLNYALKMPHDTSASSLALIQPYLKSGRRKMDEIRTVVANMIQNEDKLLSDRTREQKRYALATPFLLTSLSLLSLGIMIVSFFRIKNNLAEQQKTRASLMVQNETFRHAEESAGQGTYAWNEQTKTISFSENFYRLLGVEPGTFTSFQEFIDYVNPTEREYVEQMGIEAYLHRHPLDIRFKITTRQGTQKYVRATGKTILSEGIMMVGTLQDVTADTLLNQELKRREKQLKQAHVLGKIGVWEYNFVTNEVIWSDEMYRILGYTRGEIAVSEKTIFNIHPDDLPKLQAAIQKARETGESYEIEYRQFDRSGQIKYIYSKSEVKKDEAGNISGLLGVIMDITQLREKEKQLKESELLSKKIIELLPNIIYVFDLDKRKDLLLGGNISALLTYDPDHSYNSNDIMNELIHPGDYAKIKLHHHALRNAPDNEIHEIEYRFQFKNGKWKYMLSRDMVFKRNRKGEATQIIGVAIDITDLKKSNENLKDLNDILVRKNEELEQMNEELASFSYVASHDLQEPLRKIRTFTNLISEKDSENLSATTREYFIRITSAATRMQNLIEALLSYSRTNTSEPSYEHVNLNKLLDDTRNDLYELIREKNATIEACDLPTLNVIPLQFHQLFVNILSNAIKYSKPDVPPYIRITARIIKGKEIENAGANAEGDYWNLTFEDNGIGFEQQYENKIFELFQRLHGKGEYPGTGIGLAICKKIVQNHNGYITASGEVGVGATFHVFIPA